MMTTRDMSRLSPHGLQGLAILGIGALLLVMIALSPFLLAASLEPGLKESREFLRLLEQKSRNDVLKPRPPVLDERGVESIFVPGRTVGLASAEFQRLIGKAAADTGMAVERMQPLETERRGGLMMLKMEIDASGTIGSLRDYLHRIETGTPLVFIREVHVGMGKPSGEQDNIDQLVIRFGFEAFGWEGSS